MNRLQSAFRRSALRALLLFPFSLFLFPCAGVAADARPNFVIIMTDDQRWDAMSCAGNTVLKTPNMDRIAKEGVFFRNAFVTNSLCAPSRACLLTGQYSHSNGVMDNKGRQIHKDTPLVSDLLRKAGYEVAFCGKSHIAGALRDREWDYYFGFKDQGRYLQPLIAEGVGGKDTVHDGYMDDVVTEHAVKWLKQKREKPFCLFLFFKACHRSWVRAPRHADLFKDAAIPKPALWDDPGKGKPQAFLNADNKIGVFKDAMTLEPMVKDYYATLTAADENVGKVFDALTQLGKLDETAMLFTSDNGFFLGEWQRFDKRFMHEVSLRVPMVMRYPKLIKAGAQSDGMVLNVDIAPTMLELAGVEVPKTMHGRSWVPLLKATANPAAKPEWRKDFLYEYFEFPGPHSVKKNRGVRTERHKLIHYYDPPEEWELYDLERDPQEKENVYGKPEYAEITKQLTARLQELRKETGDTGK